MRKSKIERMSKNNATRFQYGKVTRKPVIRKHSNLETKVEAIDTDGDVFEELTSLERNPYDGMLPICFANPKNLNAKSTPFDKISTTYVKGFATYDIVLLLEEWFKEECFRMNQVIDMPKKDWEPHYIIKKE
jgi:hypothetical protein